MKLPLIKKPVLWIPLIGLMILLTWDRFLSAPFIRPYTEKGVEFYLYNLKHVIIDEMQEWYRGRDRDDELMLIFGTSHMTTLDMKLMRKMRPGMTSFHFAAPNASNGFHNYMLERILERGIKPDLIVLELMEGSANIAADQFALVYSYDIPYFWKYWNYYDPNSRDLFIRTQVFHTSRFPFYPEEFKLRLMNPEKRESHEAMKNLMIMTHGGKSPADEESAEGDKTAKKQYAMQTFSPLMRLLANMESLEENADRIYKEKFKYINLSENQLRFLDRFLETCKQNNIKVILFSPVYHEYLTALIKKSDYYPRWQEILQRIPAEYGLPHVDMDARKDSLKCHEFFDSHHLAKKCYEEQTRVFMEELNNAYPRNE